MIMAKKSSRSSKVSLVHKELVVSVLLTVGLYYLFYFVVNWTLPVRDEAVMKLVFALKWLIYPVTCLWLGVVVVIVLKLFSGNLHPLHGKENPGHKNHSHYVQNTLDNVLLLFFTVVLFSIYMPAKNMAIVPTVCIIFSLGRLFYWYGMCQGTVHSYFGKLMTILTNVAPLMYLTVRILILNFIQS